MNQTNQTFPDGFPKDPYQAVDFSYFLTDQEKQEWYDWIPNATPEQQQELVDTLHEIWQENQKEAIPQGFNSNQPGSNPAFNAPNGATNNSMFNPGAAQTPQPNRVASAPVPPTGPLPIPPNDPFGQPLNQPTRAPTTPIPPAQATPTPVTQPQAVAQPNYVAQPSTSPTTSNSAEDFLTSFSQATAKTQDNSKPNLNQSKITTDYTTQVNSNYSTQAQPKISATANSTPTNLPEDDNSSDKSITSQEENTKVPVTVNATSGDSVAIINRTNKTNDNLTLGNKNQNDRQILRNQTVLIEKVIRILNRLEKGIEELSLSQKQDKSQSIIDGLSNTTQKIHQDTGVLSEMINRLYDETSILRTVVQNQQDEIRTLKIHIEKLYTQNLRSKTSDSQTVLEEEIKPNQNPTNNPFGNPFR